MLLFQFYIYPNSFTASAYFLAIYLKMLINGNLAVTAHPDVSISFRYNHYWDELFTRVYLFHNDLLTLHIPLEPVKIQALNEFSLEKI